MHRSAALLVLLTAAALPAADNLVPNGDFAAGWTSWAPSANDKGSKVQLASEDGNAFLRMTSPTQVLTQLPLALDPTWKQVTVSGRMRVSGLVTNPAISWGTARFANSFILADGKSNYSCVLELRADTDATKEGGWVTLTKTIPIPAGAVKLQLACANFGTAGQIDFDDVTVTAE